MAYSLKIITSSGFYLITPIIFKGLFEFLIISVHTSSQFPSDNILQ